MAVTRGATTSLFSSSTDPVNAANISHTVDSGTTLLAISIQIRADFAVTGTPQWSLGGGENLTLVHATASTGEPGDMRAYVYALVNPTAGAGTVTIALNGPEYASATAVNYIGTEATSVAAATNFLSDDVNDTATDTSVHASAGSAGNALYFVGSFRGGDGDPASDNAIFNELFNGSTGTHSTLDGAYYVADLLNSAPSAITVTWAVTDENASIYIEIVAASGIGRLGGIDNRFNTFIR